MSRRLGLPDGPIERAIRLFGRMRPNAFFIQIGANDGVALDPLRREIARRQWRGIMVEPVPYVFERLRERYGGHPRIKLEPAAIADRDGALPFYHLREASPGEELWGWYHALGSFRREVVVSHKDLIPDIETRMVVSEVPAMTFASLCRKHEVERVDLLQIDTEGYDFEILKTLDLEQVRPTMIIYEDQHLSSADREAALSMLRGAGYACIEHGLDTAALDVMQLHSDEARLRAIFETPDGSSRPSRRRRHLIAR